MILTTFPTLHKYKTGLFIGFFFLLQVAQTNANDLVTAKQLYSKGEYQQSLTILETLPKLPETYAVMLNNLLQVDIDQAEKLSDQAVAAINDEPELYLLRASIMSQQAQNSIFSALGYAEKALNSFKKAAELAPDSVKYQKALMMFYLAAPSIAGGDEELGLKQVERIKALDEIEGQIALSRYYQMTDQTELLKTAVQTALLKYPSEVSFPLNFGMYLAQQEQFEEAMKYLSVAAEIALPEPIKDETTNEQSTVYTRNALSHLHALYQIGRIAVLSKKYTAQGITAMKTLFSEMEHAEFDSVDLPKGSWGRVRLAELLITADDIEQANAQLDMINVGEDKDLKKAVKKLRKNAR